jgi:hypothetical protein
VTARKGQASSTTPQVESSVYAAFADFLRGENGPTASMRVAFSIPSPVPLGNGRCNSSAFCGSARASQRVLNGTLLVNYCLSVEGDPPAARRKLISGTFVSPLFIGGESERGYARTNFRPLA